MVLHLPSGRPQKVGSFQHVIWAFSLLSGTGSCFQLFGSPRHRTRIRHLPRWSYFLFMESIRDCLLENKPSRQEPLIDLSLPLWSQLYFLMWLLSFVSFLVAWNVVLEFHTFSLPFSLITVFWAMYFSGHCFKLIF